MTPRARPAPSPLHRPVEEVTLSNGMRCLLRPQHHIGIVAVQCLLDVTVFDETEKHAGLANLVQRALRRGTAHHTALELDLALEAIGASLSAGMSDDCAALGLQTTKDDLETALPLLGEVLWEPSFTPDEVRRERDQILAEIRLRDDDPFSLAYRHFRRALYGRHPYGSPVEGTPETVARLGTGLCRQWHRKMFHPSNVLLVAVGHFEPKALVPLLEKHIAARHTATGERPESRLRALTTNRPRRAAMSRPLEQSVCLVGWPAPSIEKIQDAAAMKVAAGVLGAGMSSRLFQRLRDEQGLAYSVGCSFGLRRATGHLLAHIGTKPETATQATRGLVSEVQALGRKKVPEDELERTKTHLRGAHLIDQQTNARQAWHLGWGELTGLGADFAARWPEMLDAVTAADIMRVVKRHASTPTIVTLKPARA